MSIKKGRHKLGLYKNQKSRHRLTLFGVGGGFPDRVVFTETKNLKFCKLNPPELFWVFLISYFFLFCIYFLLFYNWNKLVDLMLFKPPSKSVRNLKEKVLKSTPNIIASRCWKKCPVHSNASGIIWFLLLCSFIKVRLDQKCCHIWDSPILWSNIIFQFWQSLELFMHSSHFWLCSFLPTDAALPTYHYSINISMVNVQMIALFLSFTIPDLYI